MRVQVDKEGIYRESNESNNCAWARERRPSSGSTVTLLSRGTGCTPPGVTPSPTPSPTSVPIPTPNLVPTLRPTPA